jgi:CheY-like chemotaxis protein
MSENQSYTIMVVDDNDDVRRLLKKVLLAAGHNVIEATDGNAALKAIDNTVPDLVLMDIKLPGGMDGLETTLRIKEDARFKEMPVVALSASVTEKDRQRAVMAGCSGFIGKPIDVAELAGQVERYVEGEASPE